LGNTLACQNLIAYLIGKVFSEGTSNTGVSNMAKKEKSDVNRTQAIKDYLAQNPDAMPKATAEDLQKQGVEVSAQHVSAVKHSLKKEAEAAPAMAPPEEPTPAERAPRKKVRRKKVRRKKKVAAEPQAADDKISLSALKEAKKLAERLGGIEQAKEALSALAQLTD
jgi:hypothetical protein